MTRTDRGRGENPKPIRGDEHVIKLKGCPDCQGRGWFLIQPFASGGSNGAGGLSNMTQCLTCLHAHAFWERNKRLPDDVAQRMKIEE